MGEVPDEELISTAEAAEILGLTKRRVRQAADRLGGRRTESGRYLYSRRLVEQYRRQHIRRSDECHHHGQDAPTLRVLEQIAEELVAIRRLLERSQRVDGADRDG